MISGESVEVIQEKRQLDRWERIISAPFMFALGFALGIVFTALAVVLAGKMQ